MIEIHDLETFASYEADMDALLKRSTGKNLYMTYEYVYTWLSYFDRDRFTILLLKKGDFVVGFVLLVKKNFSRWPLFHTEGGDYADFLMDDSCREEAMRYFLDYIFSNLHSGRIEVGHLHSDSLNLPLIKEYARIHKKPIEDSITEDAPYIIPEGSFEEYAEQKLKRKSTVSDTLRCIRRLDEVGSVRYVKIADARACSRDELMRYLDLFFEMHQKQWAKSKFRKEKKEIERYKEFAYRALQKGYFELALLYLDEKIIAMHYGFKLNTCRYYFTPAYDIDYKHYSPGKILLYRLIKNSFEEGVEFDFQKGKEPYKLEWTDQVQERVVIHVYRNSIIQKFIALRRRVAK